MIKATSQSRAQRRNYEKFLKKTNPAAYKEWKENSIERGKRFEEEQTRFVEDKQTAALEGIQNKMIQDLRNEGKSQEEIDRHVAIWIKTLKPWGSNEKPLSWTEAVKEYELELSSND
jgi:hypothetical protein